VLPPPEGGWPRCKSCPEQSSAGGPLATGGQEGVQPRNDVDSSPALAVSSGPHPRDWNQERHDHHPDSDLIHPPGRGPLQPLRARLRRGSPGATQRGRGRRHRRGTPAVRHRRLAGIISHKYAESSSPRVRIDLKENHGRAVSRCLIQDVADAVAAARRGGLVLRPAEARGAARHGGDRPGRDLNADGRGRLAGGDGGPPGLPRCRGRAAAHDLPGGDPGVWQGVVPGPPGVGVRP
jgi:hypothetical protein